MSRQYSGDRHGVKHTSYRCGGYRDQGKDDGTRHYNVELLASRNVKHALLHEDEATMRC